MGWREFWTNAKGRSFPRFNRQLKHPVRKRVVQLVSELGRTVIDVGCASCIDYPLFKRAGMAYAGIDFTPQFIEYAKRRHPEVEAQVADAINIPYPEHSFDVAYCKDLLEHQPPKQWKIVLDEMWRVARKAVIVVFFVAPDEAPIKYELKKLGRHPYWENKYNTMEIREYFQEKGDFKSLEIIEEVGVSLEGDYVIYVAVKTQP